MGGPIHAEVEVELNAIGRMPTHAPSIVAPGYSRDCQGSGRDWQATSDGFRLGTAIPFGGG